MEYIILLIVIIIIAVVIRVLISKPKTGNATKAESNLSDNQRYYIGDKCIGLSPRKGYDKFNRWSILQRSSNYYGWKVQRLCNCANRQ